LLWKDVLYIIFYIPSLKLDWFDTMITAAQMRAARALLGIDQRELARLSGVSLPTIQRMEASAGNVRGVVDTLTKVVEALDRAGIELIGPGAPSVGTGRGVRLRHAELPKAHNGLSTANGGEGLSRSEGR
jgi:transcriptional regulator with XRE-family HTH domain